MKKLLILLTLLLAWTACAAAQEPALWPAYDEASGLWGYIDETGEWAIAPQFGYAGDFHGDCASAGTASPETGEQAQGVIDGNGAYLLQPEYLIQDHCSDEHHAAAQRRSSWCSRTGVPAGSTWRTGFSPARSGTAAGRRRGGR